MDGGRKYKIALFLLGSANVMLFGGFISSGVWATVVLAVGGGYGLINASQKIWRKK